jgi:hypothetical protein
MLGRQAKTLGLTQTQHQNKPSLSPKFKFQPSLVSVNIRLVLLTVADSCHRYYKCLKEKGSISMCLLRREKNFRDMSPEIPPPCLTGRTG